MGKNAIIIVDPQQCFIKEGSKYSITPQPEGIIPIIKRISKRFDFCLMTKKLFDGLENSEIYPEIDDRYNTFAVEVDEKDIFSTSHNSKYMGKISIIDFLKDKEVDKVFLVGPIDLNVKETSVNFSNFFETYVIIDGVRYHNNIKDTLQYLLKNNIKILNSTDLSFFNKK